MRTTNELRRKLEEAAKRSGTSLAQEVERRLDRSFEAEDVFTAALGGPELRNYALMMISSFAAGGESAAGGRPAKEWLHNQDAYREALLRTATALFDGLPSPSLKEKELTMHALVGRVASSLIESGELVFYDKAGKPMKPGFQGEGEQ